jgi:hypothetical protein
MEMVVSNIIQQAHMSMSEYAKRDIQWFRSVVICMNKCERYSLRLNEGAAGRR